MVSIENPELVIPSTGATFEGRDRFAPAAALIASGEARLDDLGPDIDPGSSHPAAAAAARTRGWRGPRRGMVGRHLRERADQRLPEDLADIGLGPGSLVTVRFHGAEHEVPWVAAYADVGDGEELLHVDSYGLVALAVRGGRADRDLGLVASTVVSFSG